MSDINYKEISLNGLWKNNPGLVQLLGMCPMLAVTASTVNAMGMALATAVVLAASNAAVSMVRNVVPDTIRLPTFVIIIASVVTVIELMMQAYAFPMYQVLGIFLPLITTNCIVLGRADGFACKNKVLPAAFDGFMMGAGFGLVLILLGMSRELFGTGVLFSNMQLLFGPEAKTWAITVFPNYPQYLFAILPPGAFIFFGFFVALKNLIDKQIKDRAAANAVAKPREDRRVRVTGTIS